MKYVIYVRASTKEQQDTLESQEMDGIKYCKARNKPYVVFIEPGKSGAFEVERRPQLMQAIDCMEKGDVLLALSPDRLARSEERSVIKYFLRQKKALLEYIDGTIVSDDPNEIITEETKNFVAKIERQLTRSRVLRNVTLNREKNQCLGTCPYGWKRIKPSKNLVPDQYEQMVLNEMMRLADTGLSLRQIAANLNESGFHNRAGKGWQHKSIDRILKKECAMPSSRFLPATRPTLIPIETQSFSGSCDITSGQIREIPFDRLEIVYHPNSLSTA